MRPCVLLQYLDQMKQFVHENLKFLSHAPSVQMQDVPPDSLNLDLSEDDPDVRNHAEDRRWVWARVGWTWVEDRCG